MDPAAAKQQIVERIKQASDILVTVSNDPSLDQLAACIGLTLMLNKMGKHATAVFSGRVPSLLEFLQPEKMIEGNTDSLQDFIISLDKNKADKLRYKVENDVVRIFITPYRTSLSEKDLVFSQGDFNVEVVMALGVKDRSQLDKAITAHGRILHDATVVSVNAGNDKAAELGQINWQEPTASSLCEMLVSISEAFGTGLIDSQMATAFLTGIVAETKRFSNDKTSPKTMTMSAQLMAAGANQQLIVSKLEPPPPPVGGKPVPKKPAPQKPKAPTTGVLNVSHEPKNPDSLEVEVKAGEIRIDNRGNLTSSPADMPAQPAELGRLVEKPAPVPLVQPVPSVPSVSRSEIPPPAVSSISGSHALLDPTEHQPAISPPFTADTEPRWYDPQNAMPTDPLSSHSHSNDVLRGSELVVKPPETGGSQLSAPLIPGAPTIDDARSAVHSAINAVPFDPAEQPIAGLGAQPLSQPLHPHSDPSNPPPPVPPPLMPTPGHGTN